jgi:hypothetical protein
MMRGLLAAFLLTALATLMPGLSGDSGAVRASTPPHCQIQRSAYCIWMETEARLRHIDDYRDTEIILPEAAGIRAHRIVEPSRCLEGPADIIPAYPVAAEVRRTAGGWLHFTLRLRRNGSCDLQISQQVPANELGTEYDRVMGMPLYICLGEARAANVAGPETDREFTRQGTACSLKY